MESKTPISALQEYLVSKGKIPRYDLIKNGTGTHNPVFAYRVQVDMYCEEGEGHSKQVAKHRAAEKMLKTLNIEHSDSVCDLNFASMTSTENFVGQLKDFCILQNYPEPRYDVEEEAGPPHSRVFKIVCIVSQLREYGISKTKKTAKQIAAAKMMELLNKCTTSREAVPKEKSLNTPEPKQKKQLPGESPSMEQIIEKIKIKNNYTSTANTSKNPACYYKDHHKAYLHLPEKSLTVCKLLNKERVITIENAESLLNEIVVELDAIMTQTIAPKDEKEDSETLVFLVMSGELVTPPLAGVGSDDKTASLNLINSLLILCSTHIEMF